MQVEKYYKFWDNSENTDYIKNGDYLDLFKISDALITDSGSFLAEYLPTGKPLLLLQSKKTVGYNEFGNKIIQSYYKASKWEDIEFFITKVIVMNGDYMKEQRNQLIPFVLPNVNMNAGELIVNNIENTILDKGA